MKFYVKYILIEQPDDFYKVIANDEHRQRTLEDLTRELQDCEVKYSKRTQLLANLEHRFLSGEVDKEAYQLLKARYVVERDGVDTRRKELIDEMRQAGREKEAAESLAQLALIYRLKLLVGDLPNDDWRSLFVALNLRIRVPTATERQQVLDHNTKSELGEIAAHMADDPYLKYPYIDMSDIAIELDVPLPKVLSNLANISVPQGSILNTPNRDIVKGNPELG